MDKTKKIFIISSDSKLKDVLAFCFDGWGYEVYLKDFSTNLSVETIKANSPDVIIIDVQSARKTQLDICRHLKDNFTTTFIPVITLINKRHLREHLLNLKQGVDDYMIKPPDPLDLRIRIEMALRRAQHSIQASSLTGLPGGRMLEDILTEKVKADKPFTFGYVDIDNFKSFNDVYGYQRGDRVILQTAYMLFTILRSLGNSDDFVSHIGGDDFAFITTPDKYERVCQHFIQMFDSVIPFHYSEADRARKFIIARDRSRKIKKAPLMSISIALINRDYSSNIKSTIEINEKIAEIKRYLKATSESNFMVDRRDSKASRNVSPQVNKKTDTPEKYKPLGQMLLEKKLISHEQLDEALNIHWKRGIILGEVLKDLGFLADEDLKKVLCSQEVSFSYPILKS